MLEAAAGRLGLDELELPPEFGALAQAQETVMAYDVARNLESEYKHHRERLSTAMREYIERGQAVRRKEAEDGAALGRAWRERLPEMLAGLDALLVPAAAGEAPLRSEGHTGDPLFCRAWTLLGRARRRSSVRSRLDEARCWARRGSRGACGGASSRLDREAVGC